MKWFWFFITYQRLAPVRQIITLPLPGLEQAGGADGDGGGAARERRGCPGTKRTKRNWRGKHKYMLPTMAVYTLFFWVCAMLFVYAGVCLCTKNVYVCVRMCTLEVGSFRWKLFNCHAGWKLLWRRKQMMQKRQSSRTRTHAWLVKNEMFCFLLFLRVCVYVRVCGFTWDGKRFSVSG